ncbi:MAG: glucosaminidase domain-containing protein [Gammaproteobacteria bacterium]|nr:glucosaminidase domain-containing protein [Gammaproteobacteria bacterium]
MVKILTFLAVTWLMLLFTGHAIANQYGYYPPARYASAPAYYRSYAPAPYAYHPASRYRTEPAYYRPQRHVRNPVFDTSRGGTQAQSAAEDRSVVLMQNHGSGDQAENSVTQMSDKKRQFISALLPHIEQENKRLTELRNTVSAIIDKLETSNTLDGSAQQQLNKLAARYRVKGDPLRDKAARDELLRKIDIIPASLALAQAANESAWGESRFAQEANNLFGIWTYDQAKGLKPKNRENGKTHRVRIFDDIGASVRYYIYNLNSHPAYRELRQIRQQLRVAGKDIDGYALAAGLEKYSAQGQVYIELIRDLIEQNEWALLDSENRHA